MAINIFSVSLSRFVGKKTSYSEDWWQKRWNFFFDLQVQTENHKHQRPNEMYFDMYIENEHIKYWMNIMLT